MIPSPLRIRLLAVAIALGTICMAHAAAAQSADSATAAPTGVIWFPQQPLFPRLLADGTAPRTSVSKDLQSRRIVGSIGGLERFAQFHLGTLPAQVSIGATVYGNFIKTPSVLDVVTVDFFVDFPLDIQLSERLAFRTGWGHYSAHLADDGIEALGGHSINYAKDYIPLLASYTLPTIGGFAYGGARFDYYTIPAHGKHWLLQAGTEFGNARIFTGVSLYGAIDLKAKQEVAWGTTQSYQIGVKTLALGAHAVRFAYTYRTGIDDRGQFYTSRVTMSMIGVYLDV